MTEREALPATLRHRPRLRIQRDPALAGYVDGLAGTVARRLRAGCPTVPRVDQGFLDDVARGKYRNAFVALHR